ncbi:MAG: aspartyl/asparaginyl beta-hydroxylase domain-containing protein [Flavobacteriales bacterium]|nr:aspartyl/asparaginyl beta-hydroxylase domain-containing protein [Flavobacteriales bacterium]
MIKKGVVTHIKFPMQFEEEKLMKDLAILLDKKWQPHFNTNGYEGEWTIIPLYAPKGDENNIWALSHNNENLPVETALLKLCPYFKEVIDSFKFPIVTARILKLNEGAFIKTHTDHELGYEDHTFRLHIPITTNNLVEFILNEERLTMLPGDCWYTNVNYPHSVANRGNKDRVHLVIDGKRNEWSDELFFSMEPKERFIPPPPEDLSREALEQVISELKTHNAPEIQQHIKKLEEKLKEYQ